MKKPNSQKLDKADYERLGRMLQSIYQSNYADRKQMYKMSFVKGVMGGLGGVIGATIVAGLLLWVLSLLNYTPLRPVTERIQETVESSAE